MKIKVAATLVVLGTLLGPAGAYALDSSTDTTGSIWTMRA